MQRIAIFGGSFDPPHLGHLLAAVSARATADLDAVWVVPAARHPWSKQLTPWEIRWELCQRAFTPLGPWVRLCDHELRNPSGRTFDLLPLLQADAADARWFLIGGSDTAKDLPRWHRGDELAAMLEVVIVPRRGAGGDDHPAALPAISSSLIRQRVADGESIAGLVPRAVAEAVEGHRLYRP